MSRERIVQLNNQAVAFMKQNQLRHAVSAASLGLKYQKALEMASVSEESGIISNCCVDDLMMQSDLKEFPCSHLSTEFVYQQGIPLPSSGITNSAAMTAVLIFNLALGHHLLSMQLQGEESLHLLQKAKRMYELADKAHNSEEDVLFHFVVINNRAVIHKALGDWATAKKCMDYLLSILMIFVHRGCSVQLRHVHGFLANMDTNKETAAPAA